MGLCIVQEIDLQYKLYQYVINIRYIITVIELSEASSFFLHPSPLPPPNLYFPTENKQANQITVACFFLAPRNRTRDGRCRAACAWGAPFKLLASLIAMHMPSFHSHTCTWTSTFRLETPMAEALRQLYKQRRTEPSSSFALLVRKHE